MVPHAGRFGLLLRMGQVLRPQLPPGLRSKIPPRRVAGPWPDQPHARIMLALASCAQSAAAPDTNAAARVLDQPGIRLVTALLPDGLDRRLVAALSACGIHRLYSHRAQALDLALAGRHVAVATPTASGKSLC